MKGYRTYTGLIVSLLGIVGVAKYFGTTAELTNLINAIMEIMGLLFAAYGRYKANETN
jgi:hypothetical protein